jgi:hypothetical protein
MATFTAPSNWIEAFIDGEAFYMDTENNYKLYNLDGTEVKTIENRGNGIFAAPDMDISSIAAEEDEEEEEEDEEQDEEQEDEEKVYMTKTCSCESKN